MNIQTNKWIFQDDTTTTGDGNVFRTGRNDLVTVFITGTSSSRTIVFEGCDGEDTPNWYSLSAIKLPDRTIAESTTGIDEAWEIPLANFVAVRCRVSAVAGGTVRVTGRVVEVGAGMVGSKEVSLLAGTNIAGKVGIDQTTDGTTNRVVAKISQVEGENLVQLSGSIVEIGGVSFAVSGGDTLRGKSADKPDAVAAHAVIPYCYYFSIDTGIVEATNGTSWVVI